METHTSVLTQAFILRVLLPIVSGLSLSACQTVDTRDGSVIQNSLGMRFVKIPAGEFSMGSQESIDQLRAAYPSYSDKRLMDLSDEAPAHRVRIMRAFYLGQHEVTVAQFKEFLDASGYVPESVADRTGGYGYNPNYDPDKTERKDAFEGRDPRYSWKSPGFEQTDDSPVVNVTWNDAVAMASWLSQKEGKAYRLPTEAEWEYSCRAGSTSRYGAGDDPKQLLSIANTFDADASVNWKRWKSQAIAGSDGYVFTAPVGSFAPNAFGIHDMLGNVWEWVSDWYQADYYAQSPVADPTGPRDGQVKIRRGGSWHTWSLYARCSFRNWNTPQTRYTLVGFRLLREL